MGFLIFSFILCIFTLTELAVYFYGKNVDFIKPDLIVILGCGNKTNNPLLNDRLELAIKAHSENPTIPILLTGDEKNKSEISSMTSYLKSKIPQAQLLFDPNSLTTWDSFAYLKKNFSSMNLLIVTNEFHQRRSLFFAKLQNLSAKACGKDLHFSYSSYFFIRERVARLLIYKHLITNKV